MTFKNKLIKGGKKSNDAFISLLSGRSSDTHTLAGVFLRQDGLVAASVPFAAMLPDRCLYLFVVFKL